MNSLSHLGLLFAWLAIIAMCWLGWQLVRQNGRLLLRLEELEKRLDESEFGEATAPGLPVGSDAPAFELLDLTGKEHSLAQYKGHSVLLVFFNPDCGFCQSLLPKLAELSPSPQKTNAKTHLNSAPQILILTTGLADTNRRLFDLHKLTFPVLLQKKSDIAATYGAYGTPSSCLISADGKVASRLAMGTDALRELAEGKPDLQTASSNADEHAAANGEERANRFGNHSLARSKIKRDGLKAGTVAPDFRLPRLDGRGDLSLSDLRGQRVLLVFSSPSCGPCLALAPLLEEFHRAHPELEVVMISKGEPKENRDKIKKHDLTFPVVLQQQWEISRRYAMFATPVAYVIDETGVIAKDVAVGAESILQLASNG